MSEDKQPAAIGDLLDQPCLFMTGSFSFRGAAREVYRHLRSLDPGYVLKDK